MKMAMYIQTFLGCFVCIGQKHHGHIAAHFRLQDSMRVDVWLLF